ncbi:MAG: UDP-2,4-diacetamido-2,4,6-trideoxy-beta-L-altropyranose hydrolase [Micropepsaceae bacterium]
MQTLLEGAALIVRADAGVQAGAGHVMRCLALMQAWRARGGVPVLAAAECPSGIVDRVKASADARIAIVAAKAGSAGDADETAAIAARFDAAWVVVDGYGFQPSYVERLQRTGVRVLLLDDLGGRGCSGAEVVLNQNMHASAALYQFEADATHRLLGLDYFLLREEFWPWRGWVREIAPKVRRIGIALGGADPTGQTRRLIHALDDERFQDIEIDVIAGPANPLLGEIRAAAAAATVKVTVNACVGNMARFLKVVDLLISTAGVTAWEAAFLSTPMMLGTVGPQEEALARRLAEVGGCIYLGPFELLDDAAFATQVHALVQDRPARAALASACSGLIDGRGAERVVEVMTRETALVPC